MNWNWDTFLDVLAVVGIIAASVVIIFFIAKLVIVSTDKNKRDDVSVAEDNSVTTMKNETTVEEYSKDEVKSWDESMANSERGEALDGEGANKLVYEENPNALKMEKDFNAMDDAFDDEEEVSASDEEINRMIEKINTESIAEYKENNRIKDEESEEVDVKSYNNETIFEIDNSDEKSELARERRELKEAQKQIEEERANLEEQKRQLQEEMRRLEELKKEQANTIVVTDVKSIYANETLDQLEARLEILNKRLKENKRDLRENRKEYNPLARVKKTLEKDKAKLTRKEAIVARQKVILYGVNNYVDIDEEKAKKLNEELDLLEGLRLSVQHCEDVMNANKDRFPILEKTNKILKKTNSEILADIAEVEKAIAEKKGE